MDYLDHAGCNRAGALAIRTNPDSLPRESSLAAGIELPYLLEAVQRIEAVAPVPAKLAHYFEGGPAMGGMRPQALIDVDGRQFVARFPSTTDRRFNVLAVEYAPLALSRECGFNVPTTRLKRFDGEQRQT